MSQSILISALLSYQPLDLPAPITVGLKLLGLTQSGSKYVSGVLACQTTGTLIPVSTLANLGLAAFYNLDPTNSVQIYNAISDGIAIPELLPGDVALFRFAPGVTAPAIFSANDPVNVEYIICEN